MKFGKRLLAEAERRWLPYYLDYKALKRAIQADVDAKDPEGPAFERTLAAELARVSEFYSRHEEELADALATLAAAPAPRDAAAVAKLRSELHHLRKYVVLNSIAVVKASKKRNRHLLAACAPPPPPRQLRAAAILTSQPFYTSLRLAAMTTHAEVLAAETSPAAAAADVLEDFQCPICLGLLRSPVVLTCAHRFCWGCLVAHCSVVAEKQLRPQYSGGGKGGGKGGGEGERASPASVLRPAVWESSDDEGCTVATFGCPCCRKDHLLDLDRLQVDPHLDAFLQRLPQASGAAAGAAAAVSAAAAAADADHAAMEVLSMTLEPPEVAPAPPRQHQQGAQKPRTPAVAIRAAPQAMEVDDPKPAATPALLAAAEAPAAAALPAAAAVPLPPPSVPPSPPGEAPLLPPQRPEHTGRLCVCLDLDGTLVTTFTPKRAPSLPATAVSYVVGRGGRLNPGGVFVVERPGLGAFLRGVSSFAEVVVFTAGLEDYASPIFDEIEARYGAFSHRLYRDACVHSEVYPCIKDLSRLGRPPERCVLVDDTPLAFFRQPDSGVPVLQFRGDVDDRLLTEAVFPLLEALAAEPDVRVPLGRRFNMRRWFAAQGLASETPSRVPLHRSPSAPAVAAAAAPPAVQQLHNAPSAQLLHASPAASVLLVCDFDRTLTDYDCGERLCDELAPELTSLLAQVQTPATFIPVTNTVLGEMQRRGVSRDAIVAALRGMGGEMPRGSLRMLAWAAKRGVDVRVLSDANSVFIGHMLTAAKAHTFVKEVITNGATFQRLESSASAALAAAAPPAKAAMHHRLVVTPRHDHAALGPHGCPLCPPNLCKGSALDALRTASRTAHRRVVYAGDGANDLCPALCLGPEDVVLARAGHPLERLIAERAAGGVGLGGDDRRVAAQVLVWRDHDELCRMVQDAAA